MIYETGGMLQEFVVDIVVIIIIIIRKPGKIISGRPKGMN